MHINNQNKNHEKKHFLMATLSHGAHELRVPPPPGSVQAFYFTIPKLLLMCTALTISPDYRPFSPYHVISHPLLMQFKDPVSSWIHFVFSLSSSIFWPPAPNSQGYTIPNSHQCITPILKGAPLQIPRVHHSKFPSLHHSKFPRVHNSKFPRVQIICQSVS